MGTSVDVVGYLQSKGLVLKRASASEVHFPCPYHGESEGERGRLYLNVDPYAEIPGLHTCFVCGEKGSLVKLQKHYGDYRKPAQEDDSHLRVEILNAASEFYREHLENETPEAIRWLRGPERGLEIETIVEACLGYAPGGNALYKHLRSLDYKTADILATGLVADVQGTLTDALGGMVTIPYFVAGNCVTIRGRVWPDGDTKMKYKTPSGHPARIYGSQALWDVSEVFITEGELDALALRQMGFPAVGVPGANVWQPSWDGYIEGLRRVWVTFDPDEAGDTGAKKLMDRIGPKARRLRLPSDVTEWICEGHTSQELRDLMADAGRSKLLVTVRDARNEHAVLEKSQGIKLGFRYLDMLLEPGLLPGQLCIPIAKSGQGKTTFLLNIMQRAAMVPAQQDIKMLFVSLEQTRSEWWERARRIFSFYNLKSSEDQCERYWAQRLQLVDKNRVSVKELESIIDDFEYEMGKRPDLVCLDYLGYWAQGFQGDRYQRTSDAVMTLKAIAKDWRVPIIAPHQVSRSAKYGEEPELDSARDSGAIEESSDFLFTLWADDSKHGKAEEDKTGAIYLRIGKSRHGNAGSKVEFQFAPQSLVLVPKVETEHAEMVQREIDWNRLGHDGWAKIVQKHREHRVLGVR